jgi:predicted transcriptional regulator
MLLSLKKEIQKANGQIRLHELSERLNVEPSVIKGMLQTLYGKDVINDSLEPCAPAGGCPSCGKKCPFAS